MKPARVKPKVSRRKRSRPASPPGRSSSKPGSKSSSDALTAPSSTPSGSTGPHWTFLTNYAHVLLLLSRNPSVLLREVALQVGITERAVQRIIADLKAGGIIDREKIGRQNRYRIRTEQSLRHPVALHRTIGELLALINGDES